MRKLSELLLAALAFAAMGPAALGQSAGISGNAAIPYSGSGRVRALTTRPSPSPWDTQPLFAGPSINATVYPPSYGCGNLVDHGGPEIANARFQAIYWNSSVANSTSTSLGYPTIQAQIDAFIDAFPDNHNWDDSATDDYTIIQQYGSTSPIANTLPRGPAYVDTQATPGAIVDSQIQSYLANLFTAGKLAPSSNTVYGVYFPAGTLVTVGGGLSCINMCAYHSAFSYSSYQIKYAVFPYPNCSACSLPGQSVADLLTMFASHEIREAVTDPGDNGVYAWYDPCGDEGDDKCAWHNLYNTSNGGFLVQPEYSNGGYSTNSGFAATYPGPGCIVPSACISAAPPTGLTAAAGNAQVSLSWSASSGATSYKVKRSTSSGAESAIASTSSTSYTDTGLTNGTTYYYKVSAVNTCGEGANSAEVSATPQAAPSFYFAAPPNGFAIGTSVPVTVTVASSAGFSGTVSLSMSGLPAGAVAIFSPPTVSVPPSGSASSLLLVVPVFTLLPGNYPVSIVGVSGALNVSDPGTLAVH